MEMALPFLILSALLKGCFFAYSMAACDPETGVNPDGTSQFEHEGFWWFLLFFVGWFVIRAIGRYYYRIMTTDD